MLSDTVKVTDHLDIHLDGGLRLSARMWRPVTEGPLPVILEVHPYPHAYSTATRDEINHGYFAESGYVALRVDTPGTGDSDGQLSDTYREDEQGAILALLDWIATQDWCDGKIGMFGHSWGAYSALQMAGRAHPALRAVAFSGASDDLYGEDCHYRGGALATENIGWAATLLSFLSRPPTIRGMGPERTQKWVERLNRLDWVLPTWLEHQPRTGYWDTASVCDDYTAVRVPVLAASGWADTYCTAVLRMAENLPGTYAGVVGPWAHKFPHMGMPEPAIGWLQEVVRWWDHWLKGRDTGADSLPRLRAFVTEDAPPDAFSASTRTGQWVALERWPLKSAKPRALFMGEKTLADRPGRGSFVIASPAFTGTEGGELMPMGWGADLPGDQRSDDGNSVCFDLPLSTDLIILGRGQIDLTITSDQPVAQLTARLCDVHPDGASTRVCYGVHNLTHDETHAQVTPLEPGKPHRISFQLDATAYRFVAGHTLRLCLSSAYWPLLWPAPKPVALGIDRTDARLVLPVLPEGVATSAEFEPAAGALPRPRTELVPPRFERSVTRDQATGETTFRVFDQAARTHDPASGITTWGDTERIYSLPQDQARASMKSVRDISVKDGKTQLRTLTVVSFHGDETSYHSEATLTAWVDQKIVAERSWKTTSPRNGT